MNSRLSGYISILRLVFFVLKSPLGIAREWSREKFAIFVRTLDIERSYQCQSLLSAEFSRWCRFVIFQFHPIAQHFLPFQNVT